MECCGVNDDLRPSLCYPDRLHILEKRENAWATLDFCKPIQVCVPFDSTGIYDFTGGAFLLGTRLYSASRRPTIGYSYVSLPSVSEAEENQKEVQWMALNLGIQIWMSDWRFSTGQPHPLAEQPIIFITTKSLLLDHCNVLIEIVGDFLALLITFPWARSEREDMFFLERLKKGEAHCSHRPYCTCMTVKLPVGVPPVVTPV
ncbi:hypothetical protein BGY98DRAFT_936521 [Russula aff. rugulosa BPL654]|nr:hypothetical protein BGY98DRAFT_936521 [Russula aff. rugulosa BPL654]